MGSSLQRLEVLLVGLVIICAGAAVAVLLVLRPATPAAYIQTTPQPVVGREAHGSSWRGGSGAGAARRCRHAAAEALAIAESCGDSQGISRAHKELGYLALKQGALGTAQRHWRTAIRAA